MNRYVWFVVVEIEIGIILLYLVTVHASVYKLQHNIILLYLHLLL